MGLNDLTIDTARLESLCEQYRVTRLEAFGSFVRGDAAPDSDLDLMVTFEAEATVGLHFVALHEALEECFGRPVDLVTRAAVESSPNKYFRRFALRDTEAIYERR